MQADAVLAKDRYAPWVKLVHARVGLALRAELAMKYLVPVARVNLEV
jgi:hypothetical protein